LFFNACYGEYGPTRQSPRHLQEPAPPATTAPATLFCR